jgi:cytochrome bd ubiquinol oxidase subunit II
MQIANLDLPVIWAGLIAVAVFLYVVLDGFDLGVGILFPFAADARERDQMVASIAPVWDGNETWLILGGGGLLAVFPLAYSALMPALYLPVSLMLIALIFRGVAFEFRHHGVSRGKRFWTGAFFCGSLGAALAQGIILGGFIQGIKTDPVRHAFIGGGLDWLTPFSLAVGIGLAIGYALLGAGWLVFKTTGPLHERAQSWTQRLAIATGIALFLVSAATLTVDPQVTQRWGISISRGVYDWGRFLSLAWLPGLALSCIAMAALRVRHAPHRRAYQFTVALFALGFAGLAISVWPNVIPFGLDIHQAAAADNALLLMLIGALITLPVILGYTCFVYWVFRAKVPADAASH